MIWQDERLPGITFAVEEVTPTVASEWLDTRKEQRSIMKTRVEQYGRDMELGYFPFTGDPVRFSNEGRLIDGQHRLEAIRNSGTNQLLLVVRGLDKQTIQHFDLGARRSFASYLQMREVPSASYVAAVTTALWRWDEGGDYGIRNVARLANPSRSGVNPNYAELWSTYERNPMIIESVRAAARIHTQTNKTFISISKLGLFWMLLTRIDKYARDQFVGELCGTIPLGDKRPGYPIKLLIDRMSRRGGGEGEPQWVGLSLFIRTWNAWREGEILHDLRRVSQPRWDLLPMPVGLKEAAELDAETDSLLDGAGEDDE